MRDIDLITIERIARPQISYFMPVVVFIVLVYFRIAGINLPDGYVQALFGISVLSMFIVTLIVGIGLLTNEWYRIDDGCKSIIGNIIIAILSLFGSQITFYVIGFTDYWFPPNNVIIWFIFGFFIYQFMVYSFKFFYDMYERDKRLCLVLGILISTIVGILPIYVALGFGVV